MNDATHRASNSPPAMHFQPAPTPTPTPTVEAADVADEVEVDVVVVVVEVRLVVAAGDAANGGETLIGGAAGC